MAISVNSNFKIQSPEPIDTRTVLTKTEMLAINDSIMPDVYYALCKDDGQLYIYNKNNSMDATTGKFRIFKSGDGTTYTFTQDTSDGHKITITSSKGDSQVITIPDNNTTYTLTQDTTNKNKLTFTPSTGSATEINIPTKAKEIATDYNFVHEGYPSHSEGDSTLQAILGTESKGVVTAEGNYEESYGIAISGDGCVIWNPGDTYLFALVSEDEIEKGSASIKYYVNSDGEAYRREYKGQTSEGYKYEDHIYATADETIPYEKITTSIDANTYQTTGIYVLINTSNTNLPIAYHGTLIVEANVGTPYQLFIPDATYTVYKRYMSNVSTKTWGAWKNIVDLDSKQDVLTTSSNIEVDSISLNTIHDSGVGECGGNITLKGGNSRGIITITAEGEDGTPALTLTGSSSDSDSIQLSSNNIKFNNVEVPKNKTGTIALLSDISGVSNVVTYETSSVGSTMDMKSVVDSSGERQSKAACFGSFDSDTGDTIGVGSDGVYLYMPWSGKSQSYGHLIAGDDSTDDGDGSLFHTALSGDDEGDVPSFRKILDSYNYTDYVSGKAPYGFNYASSATWGNQIGTCIADWSDGSGGDIQFRKSNPSSGKTSMLVDGTVYVNEGYDRVLARIAQYVGDQGNYQTTYSNYVKLDNGVMIAWGRMYSSGGDMTIAFPTSFSDTPLVVVTPVYNHTAYVGYATETYYGVRVESQYAYEVGGYLNWIAIGRSTART